MAGKVEPPRQKEINIFSKYWHCSFTLYWTSATKIGEDNSNLENIISQPAGLHSNLIWTAVPGACISMTLGGGEYNYQSIEDGRSKGFLARDAVGAGCHRG